MSTKKTYLSHDPENLINDTANQADWDWFSQQTFRPDQPKGNWYKLFAQFIQFGASNRPSQKWLKSTQELIEIIEPQTFTQEVPALVAFYLEDESWFRSQKATLVKGLLWAASLYPNEITLRAMRQLIEKAYTKVPGKGALATKIGNTGLNALVSVKTIPAQMTLVQMKTRTKYPSFVKAIDKSLQKIQQFTGLDEQIIQDQMIPDFGIQERSLDYPIADYTAQIYIPAYNKLLTEWLKPDGQTQKSEPATVKRAHQLALKELKATQQDIKKTLQTQRHRLENTWRFNRTWEFALWKKYIFHHELIKILSHLLIWTFAIDDKKIQAIAPEGTLMDRQGNALDLKDLENAQVQLWHPVQSPVEEVLAWREFMFNYQIKQPFKQAFREVYVLTEAELATRTYSNRFSAHILEQKKLWALSQQREWKFKGFNSFQQSSPELHLPDYQLSASLDISRSMFEYEYATTQRVRFLGLANAQEKALKQVHPVAFSEVMRDIDLFIAISSIGNDPNWDGSEDYRDYWLDYAYGDKSDTVSAKNRKDLLMRIIPLSKIASQCSFEGNFLRVQGQIRAYKINIGSANILMEPNDEYLCIVPDRRSKQERGKIFLPVEGDTLLSLILSKAFLLAEDDKIEDSTILSQIHRQ